MGALRNLEDAHRVELLPTRCLVGRSRSCDLQLAAGDISSQHAVVQWTGVQWELQDLASRNGTFIDDRRLAHGERVPLRCGARLRFARMGSWELVDDGAPEPMARNLVDGRICLGEHGQLAIPDPERPELTLQAETSGRWVLERSGEVTDIIDRMLLLVGADEWRIHLPSPGSATLDESSQGLHIADIRLRFAHTINEEYIELVAFAGERRIDLKARAHHYPLLLLARARAADQAQGVALADQGWLLQERLLEMLKIDMTHLNIIIHRSRAQLAQAGVSDAARLIERRQGTRQLRIGVAHLEIVLL
jgi:hypothetical protein